MKQIVATTNFPKIKTIYATTCFSQKISIVTLIFQMIKKVQRFILFLYYDKIYKYCGYSDKQFYADLKKNAKRFDAMEKEAIEEHEQGKTLKFP